VLPEPLKSQGELIVRDLVSRRSGRGVEVRAEFDRGGFQVMATWFFHAARPWIDMAYQLVGGWSDEPQTVQFCFPLTLDDPTYRYDVPGAVLVAGPKAGGGDDLPGANPELFAGLTFASATAGNRSVTLLTPDTLLLQFGGEAVRTPGYRARGANAQITSMPMMNLTKNDWQFGQAGQRRWTFRYRAVLADGGRDPLRPFQEAQRFGSPPFLQAPGQDPAVPGLENLDIDFPGGPVLALKVAEDGQRLILRCWNVLERSVEGSLKLPRGWVRAEMCDALERPMGPLPVSQQRVKFTAPPRGINTVAICRRP
jgi:hypothetical protein